MKLIGNYLSPFVRRVAISLNALELPHEFQALFVFKEPEQVRAHNHVVRIPALLLDDLASKTGREGWLAEGSRLSQADITGVVAYTFANAVRPHLNLAQEVPNLRRFAARCEEMLIFRQAPLPEAVS